MKDESFVISVQVISASEISTGAQVNPAKIRKQTAPTSRRPPYLTSANKTVQPRVTSVLHVCQATTVSMAANVKVSEHYMEYL